MVIEPVNGAARNAECLSRPDVDLFSVDSPDQDSVNAIDRLFVMVVAMRRCRQALRAGDCELKGRDAAIRSLSGDQEAHREWPETDGFVRRIDVQVNDLLCHFCLRLVNGVTLLVAQTQLQPPNGSRSSSYARRQLQALVWLRRFIGASTRDPGSLPDSNRQGEGIGDIPRRLPDIVRSARDNPEHTCSQQHQTITERRLKRVRWKGPWRSARANPPGERVRPHCEVQ